MVCLWLIDSLIGCLDGSTDSTVDSGSLMDSLCVLLTGWIWMHPDGEVLLDACQSVPHLKIEAWPHIPHIATAVGLPSSQDVAELGVDFLVASSSFGKRQHFCWVFGHVPHVPPKNSRGLHSNSLSRFFCSSALQTWMLCFIYPQMTFTFMKSVVNESLMALCHNYSQLIFLIFRIILGISWDSKSELNLGLPFFFNFCSISISVKT